MRRTHIRFGQTATFNLPGGRILHIKPKGMDSELVKLEIVLLQGEEPMMTTDLEIMNRGTFMLGGPRYERGILIISIETEAPGSTEVTAPSTAVGPPRALPAFSR